MCEDLVAFNEGQMTRDYYKSCEMNILRNQERVEVVTNNMIRKDGQPQAREINILFNCFLHHSEESHPFELL